ncbi:hypothetical protein KNU78_gp06 [Gordonia phage Sukkupi]|uniref:Uncharacterized protein n=1 Tax=Gordonia phage Sukkupi TaxID=2653747 RepID=A0A5Q2WNV0_9CAUD|nr:hypothetical protein KNU78_gp06 [Gordonia phage Sukkupi]QGH79249.1 hypothetical protein SEA_SUKKUPI_6 [Gordonia phage Sukkupi]QGH80722.1 hypothetical protein SEA_YNDEXA_6 [Gordonia phage Yndexa]
MSEPSGIEQFKTAAEQYLGTVTTGERWGFGQPAPEPSDAPSAHDLVIGDMARRKEFGLAKYGTPLQHDNGRDHLVDAYKEVLDLAVYLRNEIEARHERGLPIIDPKNPDHCEFVAAMLCQPDIPDDPANPTAWFRQARQLRERGE